MIERLPELLAARLEGPLPGAAAGLRYEPRPSPGRHYEDHPADARRAAVLILLFEREGQWHVPLMVRPADLPDHAGQVCLPGGAIDVGETGEDAAIREFREELGDTRLALNILGRLSTLYVRASHFCVEPWVAVAEGAPQWNPSPLEVAELLEVPLDFFLDPKNVSCQTFHGYARPYLAPCFDWKGHRIWGATCMMLGELIALIQREDAREN